MGHGRRRKKAAIEIIKTLGQYGLIPVVVLDDADTAIPVAETLERGSLPVMEITLRTEAGLEAIGKIRREKPDYILGAGTVLTLDQCKAAVAAGASYIGSPGFHDAVVSWCVENGVGIIPGCVTPSEIDRALEMGIKVVKFFPASTYGGVAGCRVLYGPYASADIRFVPIGGIGPGNLSDYANQPFIHAVGGGWLVDRAAANNGNYEAIAETAKAVVRQLLGFEMVHVGINLPDETAALRISSQFQQAFGWEPAIGSGSIFSSQQIEVLKSPGKGRMGHLAVQTNSVDRALFYLAKRGYEADQTSIRRKADRVTFAYLKDEIGGFAIHLLQK